jgi:hypothetical protein
LSGGGDLVPVVAGSGRDAELDAKDPEKLRLHLSLYRAVDAHGVFHLILKGGADRLGVGAGGVYDAAGVVARHGHIVAVFGNAVDWFLDTTALDSLVPKMFLAHNPKTIGCRAICCTFMELARRAEARKGLVSKYYYFLSDYVLPLFWLYFFTFR